MSRDLSRFRLNLVMRQTSVKPFDLSGFELISMILAVHALSFIVKTRIRYLWQEYEVEEKKPTEGRTPID
uniref:Uncharacterized protein n=1 Tax=Glossina pallidipes TaxID=7398 RepID=A0A1A9ZF18_GLOPL